MPVVFPNTGGLRALPGNHPAQNPAEQHSGRSAWRSFADFLQADAYAGFERLYDPNRAEGLITPVACWAHVRRKLYDVFKVDPSSAAAVAIAKIKEI